MANNGLSPIAGVELDPALDPEGQQIDPAFVDDPSAPAPLVQLPSFGQLARTLTDDPITLLVAQIHEEIEQILRVHRDIYDGVQLAIEQVQDKRIEFLEAGPEVTVADFFIEVALGFLLGSPILGNILKQGFRFIGVKAVASRAARLGQLEARATQALAQKNAATRVRETLLRQLKASLEQKRAANMNDYMNLSRQEVPIQQALQRAETKLTELTQIIKGTDTAQKKTAIDEKGLKEFFKEANETIAKDYGGALVKAAASALKSKRPTSEPKPSSASGTFGVQVLSVAQSTLRTVEMYVGQAAADADMLRSIAQSDPVLRSTCFNLLSQMDAALQREEERDTKDQQSIDARQAAMLEFEKLIWAMQMPEQLEPMKPDEIRQFRKDEGPEPGAQAATAGAVAARDLARQLRKPPKRLRQYLKDQFFSDNDKVTTDNIQKILNGIKADFLTKSRDSPPIDFGHALVFKSESTSSGAREQ